MIKDPRSAPLVVAAIALVTAGTVFVAGALGAAGESAGTSVLRAIGPDRDGVGALVLPAAPGSADADRSARSSGETSVTGEPGAAFTLLPTPGEAVGDEILVAADSFATTVAPSDSLLERTTRRLGTASARVDSEGGTTTEESDRKNDRGRKSDRAKHPGRAKAKHGGPPAHAGRPAHAGGPGNSAKGRSHPRGPKKASGTKKSSGASAARHASPGESAGRGNSRRPEHAGPPSHAQGGQSRGNGGRGNSDHGSDRSANSERGKSNGSSQGKGNGKKKG